MSDTPYPKSAVAAAARVIAAWEDYTQRAATETECRDFQEEAVEKAIRQAVEAEREGCYMAARGHTDPVTGEHRDGFELFGTRQLYWKGRADAAASVRERAGKEQGDDT